MVQNDFSKTVAVLFGGRSSEHEISLRSAVFILKNIPSHYYIIPVGISREGVFHSLTGQLTSANFKDITIQMLAQIVDGQVPSGFLKSKNAASSLLPWRKDALKTEHFANSPLRILNLEASCIFPVLHGPNGEDGRLQGLFELAEMAYVGCDLRGTVIGIDKDLQKKLAKLAGIPVAKYEVVETEELQENYEQVLKRIETHIGYPCFVKPNSMGSAVGANKAKNQAELKQALTEALAFDPKALVEELLIGTEVECSFLGSPTHPRVTLAGEIAPKEFYSYEEKYADNSEASLYIPARLPPARMEELKSLAMKTAKTLGIQGMARIDFWNIVKEEKFVFNEINTIPGLTSISMYPKLLEHEGIMAPVWIEEVIERAYARKHMMDKLQFGIKADL